MGNTTIVCYTSFLASKKLFRCFICHAPMTRRIQVWPRDHHNTLELVLSLVCLNLSSRYWKRKKIVKSQTNHHFTLTRKKDLLVGNFAPWWFAQLDQAIAWLLIAIRIIFLFGQRQHSWWHVHPLGCPNELSIEFRKTIWWSLCTNRWHVRLECVR